MASMVQIWSFFFVLSVFGSSFAFETEEAPSKEFVLTLDNSNFHETVSKHDFIVVDFYAPWCYMSKKVAPEYEKAASVLSSLDPPVVLAKVDAYDKKNRRLAREFRILAYPTVMILRNGGKSIQNYYGPWDADGIVAVLKKESGPECRKTESMGDATAYVDHKKIVMVST